MDAKLANLHQEIKNDYGVLLEENIIECFRLIFNIYSNERDDINDIILKHGHSYQLHDAFRYLFAVAEKFSEFYQGNYTDIYRNLIRLTGVLGKGVYGIVLSADISNVDQIVVKSPNAEEALDKIKVTAGNGFTYTENEKYRLEKTKDLNNLLREYLINYELNKLRVPIFQQTYSIINCSRIILENVNQKDEITTFCSTKQPWVIISEKLKGDVLSVFLTKSTNSADILKLLTLLFYYLRYAYARYRFTHYDIHTDNIIVEKRNSKFSFRLDNGYIESDIIPKLIDFGLSRIEIGQNVLHSTVLKEYYVTDRYNPLYDIYKITFDVLYRCHPHVFNSLKFIGQFFIPSLQTRQHVIDIYNSQKRPIRDGVYLDKYFIPPLAFIDTPTKNNPQNYDQFYNYFFSKPEVNKLIIRSATYPKYGETKLDIYSMLNLDKDKLHFPLKSLMQNVITDTFLEANKFNIIDIDLDFRRIKKERNIIFPDEYVNYAILVKEFEYYILTNISIFKAALDIVDNSDTIEDKIYGNNEAEDLYFIICKVVDYCTDLSRRKRFLTKYYRSDVVISKISIPMKLNLKIFHDYYLRLGILKDGLADFDENFMTEIY